MSFLKKLKKYNVKLDQNGELDLSEVMNDNMKSLVKNHENLAKLTLMQADLEFEYP